MTTQEKYKLFIQHWFECDTVGDMVTKSGYDRRAIANLAATLRRNGVELPNLKPTPNPNFHTGTGANWEELKRWSKACEVAAYNRKKYRNVD